MENIKIEDSARIMGTVKFGEDVYISQGTMVISKDESVTIENNTWVLESSVVIGTKEHPVHIGRKTVFGHKCIIIGAEIGDLCEVGNGVIFKPGSKVGDMCIFGEGTIIPEGKVIPDGCVVVGRPGRIVRRLTENDKNMIARMRGNNISLSEYKENILTFNNEGENKMGKLYEFDNKFPSVGENTKIEDTAELTGDVRIGDNSYIGAGVKIIGNSHGPVIIGNNVRVLENSVLHLLPDNELLIEDNVVIGAGCIIHGTHIEKNAVIESGAIVCDYSKVGKNATVKSGTLVKQRDVVAENKIILGFPGKIIGENEELQEVPNWAVR